MRRTLRIHRLGVAAFLMLASMAGPPPALAAGAMQPMPHGRDVSPATTGPDAAGSSPLKAVGSGILRDRQMPDYARRIDVHAVYDGREVSAPHILIENVEIEGALDIATPLPVILKRVVVRATVDLPWLVLVRPEAGPVHVLWSDIGGALRSRGVAPYDSDRAPPHDSDRAPPYAGVALALRGNGARIYRSRIGAAADGVQIAARNIDIEQSFIGNLLSRPGDHNDAVQMFDSAAQVRLVANRIENAHPQTSAVTILGRDIRIAANVLAGGGWTVYAGALRNGKGGSGADQIHIVGNVFARTFAPKVGTFGPVTYWAAPPGSGNVWRDNTDERGRPVEP